MTPKPIIWGWSSTTQKVPDPKVRSRIENIALGIILAHNSGQLQPTKIERSKELSSERSFDPLEIDREVKPDFKAVTEVLFEMIFEEELVHLEIVHRWNTYIGQEDGEQEIDINECYQVKIGEIHAATQQDGDAVT